MATEHSSFACWTCYIKDFFKKKNKRIEKMSFRPHFLSKQPSKMALPLTLHPNQWTKVL